MNKPKNFAKIFDHPTLGQLLVQRTSDDQHRPCISITFDPAKENLAPCEVIVLVHSKDESENAAMADALFDEITIEMAADVAEVNKLMLAQAPVFPTHETNVH